MWVSFDYRVFGGLLYLIPGIPLGDRYVYLFGQIFVDNLAHAVDSPQQFIVTRGIHRTEAPEILQHCECDDPSFRPGRYGCYGPHPFSGQRIMSDSVGGRSFLAFVVSHLRQLLNSYLTFIVGSNVRYSPSTPHSRIV